MSDEDKSTGEAAAATAANEEPTEQPFNDEHTTEPNTQDQPPPAPPGSPSKWEMPKPVFQKTSGYLPQGYVTDIQEAARANPDNENTTQEQPVFVAKPAAGPDLSAVNLSPAVEPQPDLSEQLIPDEPALDTAPESPKKSRGLGTPMIVLGLIAIMVFVAVFLGVIYFLFLRNPTDPSPF